MTEYDPYSWQALYGAYRKAAKGKRSRRAVASFEYRLEYNLLQLQQQIAEGMYRPGGYQSFYIHEPKRRLISAAPFRDRVVHHALCAHIEPQFERSFIADSYANRIGKGTHRALDRAQEGARRFAYVLQCDVRQFFPGIDHAILCEALFRKVKDTTSRWLIDAILKSGEGVLNKEYNQIFFPGDDLLDALRPRGLPIGNLTSQFWANVYMNRFDHFVKRELRCPIYLRYVDDCAPRRRIGGRDSSVQPCCTRDEGWPLEAAMQVEASNHLLLLRLRDVVGSELGKGRTRSCQV